MYVNNNSYTIIAPSIRKKLIIETPEIDFGFEELVWPSTMGCRLQEAIE
jgi:hypothetical protein